MGEIYFSGPTVISTTSCLLLKTLTHFLRPLAFRLSLNEGYMFSFNPYTITLLCVVWAVRLTVVNEVERSDWLSCSSYGIWLGIEFIPYIWLAGFKRPNWDTDVSFEGVFGGQTLPGPTLLLFSVWKWFISGTSNLFRPETLDVCIKTSSLLFCIL